MIFSPEHEKLLDCQRKYLHIFVCTCSQSEPNVKPFFFALPLFRWWKVPEHDKAFLQGICKHGVNRSDLIVGDEDLPFHHIKKQIETDHQASEANDEDDAAETEFLWPRDLVIARRIDSLCELVLKPKPVSKRAGGAGSRKRKNAPSESKETSKPSGLKLMLKVSKKQQDYASEEDESMATYTSDEGEDTDDMLDQAGMRINSRSQASSVPSPSAADHQSDNTEEMPSKKPRLGEILADETSQNDLQIRDYYRTSLTFSFHTFSLLF